MFRKLIVLAGLACTAAAFAQTPPPAPSAPAADPAELFGVRESVEQIDISPDGQHVVYLQPGPGRSTLVVISDFGATAAPRAISAPTAFRSGCAGAGSPPAIG